MRYSFFILFLILQNSYASWNSLNSCIEYLDANAWVFEKIDKDEILDAKVLEKSFGFSHERFTLGPKTLHNEEKLQLKIAIASLIKDLEGEIPKSLGKRTSRRRHLSDQLFYAAIKLIRSQGAAVRIHMISSGVFWISKFRFIEVVPDKSSDWGMLARELKKSKRGNRLFFSSENLSLPEGVEIPLSRSLLPPPESLVHTYLGALGRTVKKRATVLPLRVLVDGLVNSMETLALNQQGYIDIHFLQGKQRDIPFEERPFWGYLSAEKGSGLPLGERANKIYGIYRDFRFVEIQSIQRYASAIAAAAEKLKEDFDRESPEAENKMQSFHRIVEKGTAAAYHVKAVLGVIIDTLKEPNGVFGKSTRKFVRNGNQTWCIQKLRYVDEVKWSAPVNYEVALPVWEAYPNNRPSQLEMLLLRQVEEMHKTVEKALDVFFEPARHFNLPPSWATYGKIKKERLHAQLMSLIEAPLFTFKKPEK